MSVASFARRPPKMNAEIGTPSGASNFDEMPGHWRAGAVKRLFGCAAGSLPGFHGLPLQSMRPSGASPRPSHHGVLSGARPTLVQIEFLCRLARAFGLVLAEVPGATPKKPASGLIAQRRPSAPMRSQEISSPTVHTFQPFCDAGGTSMAMLVLPQALGK